MSSLNDTYSAKRWFVAFIPRSSFDGFNSTTSIFSNKNEMIDIFQICGNKIPFAPFLCWKNSAIVGSAWTMNIIFSKDSHPTKKIITADLQTLINWDYSLGEYVDSIDCLAGRQTVIKTKVVKNVNRMSER